jgi:hypothetical protein
LVPLRTAAADPSSNERRVGILLVSLKEFVSGFDYLPLRFTFHKGLGAETFIWGQQLIKSRFSYGGYSSGRPQSAYDQFSNAPKAITAIRKSERCSSTYSRG